MFTFTSKSAASLQNDSPSGTIWRSPVSTRLFAYYHTDPEETHRVERRHERAAAEAEERSSMIPR